MTHKLGGSKEIDSNETLTGKAIVKVPAIFYAFKPVRAEKLITEKQSKRKKLMKKLEKQGITPIIVPDVDKDHKGSVYDDLKKNKPKKDKVQRKLRVKK